MNVNNPSKQAKRRECLQRERPVQGKNHAGKKAPLAGYLIPLLRSQKPCNKETQFLKVGDELDGFTRKEVVNDKLVKAMRG